MTWVCGEIALRVPHRITKTCCPGKPVLADAQLEITGLMRLVGSKAINHLGYQRFTNPLSAA